MNYTVAWSRDAINQLTLVWLAAANRNAVTQAAHRLEEALAQQPYIGRRRNSSVNRTVTDSPLGIDFEIIEDDKKVRIIRVWALV